MSADRIVKCPRCGEPFREWFFLGMKPSDLEGYGRLVIQYRGECRDCGLDYSHDEFEDIEF